MPKHNKPHARVTSARENLTYSVLGSNHPRRIRHYKRILRTVGFWTRRMRQSAGPERTGDPSEGPAVFGFASLPLDVSVLFAGDSHVEFYSRCLDAWGDFAPKNRRAMWLGPWTVQGMSSRARVDELQLALTRSLAPWHTHTNVVVFSFGSIDVRTTFYELLLRKAVEDEHQLLAVFERSASALFDQLADVQIDQESVVAVGIVELNDCWHDGVQPTTIRELKAIKKREAYPTFGSAEQRQRWTARVNQLFKRLAHERQMLWVPTGSLCLTLPRKTVMPDGMHISDRQAIQRINEALVDQLGGRLQ